MSVGSLSHGRPVPCLVHPEDPLLVSTLRPDVPRTRLPGAPTPRPFWGSSLTRPSPLTGRPPPGDGSPCRDSSTPGRTVRPCRKGGVEGGSGCCGQVWTPGRWMWGRSGWPDKVTLLGVWGNRRPVTAGSNTLRTRHPSHPLPPSVTKGPLEGEGLGVLSTVMD